VLINAIRDGLGLLTWQVDTFAYAEGFDEVAERYRGLRGGQHVALSDDSASLLVKPDVARSQLDAEVPTSGPAPAQPDTDRRPKPGETEPTVGPQVRRFHGTVLLDPQRVGRDASRIAEEVIAHLTGLMGADVTVTLEIQATLENGAPEHVVRTVTENSRTLKFNNQGFEKE
jgi:hypothetical protein